MAYYRPQYKEGDIHNMQISASTISDGHHRVTYRGVPMVKCPFDYVMYQMIIGQVKPDLIIEIGTWHGGNALYLADLMSLYGMGMVHTIDIADFAPYDLVNNHNRIRRFLSGFEGYDLSNAERFNNILVIDDGSHRYIDVLSALRKFKDLVSVNSYYIIEDGVLTELGLDNAEYDGGPLRAISEFLEVSDNYLVDSKWLHFFGKNATFNKDGFLKRVR